MNSNHGIDLKAITPELLAQMRATGLTDLAEQLERDLRNTPTQQWLDRFITCYPEMITMKEDARKLSKEDDCVLIMGPTGTGKEILARALHGEREGDFVPVNCGGLPEHLIESELFGHRKGAFTGADKDRIGLMEQAKDGTLFLDEIGDMDKSLQVKLLRALQEKSIRRVGDSEHRPINCRFVAATNIDLGQWVKIGLFREDLYWRLNTFILTPLPLAKRSKDIPLIVQALDVDHRIKDVTLFCAGIIAEELTGNVRTLQQLVRRFYVLGEVPGK